MPSHRDILKSVAATLTGWLIPFRHDRHSNFHFILIDSHRSRPVIDPLALENCRLPVTKAKMI
jgi:hypothetical protein